MILSIKRLRMILQESLATPRYVHVTTKDLGPHPVLRPNIPNHALDTHEEDWTTPRVCFATSVEMAVAGMDAPSQAQLYVYGVDDIPALIVPSPERRPGKGAAAVKHVVPDADETGEVWSTEPIQAQLIGKHTAAKRTWGSSDSEVIM